jgi:hypothetical protein
MENRVIINAGLAGGFVAALLNAIPFLNFINCFCCAGIMLGGAFGLYYYDRQGFHKEYISTATAVTVGLVSGIMAAFISLFLEWMIYHTFGDWQLEMAKNIVEQMDEVPLYIEEMMTELEKSMGYGFLWASVFFRNVVVLPVFCLTGSLIMRIILMRNRRFDT